ncbi:hypothetical protein HD553DRAFT_326297 [Filobasidium floriforme]|uniref:uncharacterized protein n=1 Tax=Filobasidium floriforme TaxID=5210 RepID=UPI001E8EA2DD|nr:uncharacterized protein HD553DRAFT_326297 [Filobasidium floriforme]KAH8079984.1 hypothetical protein HD553DRAFT_326297 [Filobasidium floriforme]
MPTLLSRGTLKPSIPAYASALSAWKIIRNLPQRLPILVSKFDQNEIGVLSARVTIDSQRSLLHSFLREPDEVRFAEPLGVSLHALKKIRRGVTISLEQLDQIECCLLTLLKLISRVVLILTSLGEISPLIFDISWAQTEYRCTGIAGFRRRQPFGPPQRLRTARTFHPFWELWNLRAWSPRAVAGRPLILSGVLIQVAICFNGKLSRFSITSTVPSMGTIAALYIDMIAKVVTCPDQEAYCTRAKEPANVASARYCQLVLGASSRFVCQAVLVFSPDNGPLRNAVLVTHFVNGLTPPGV